jgi:ABC-type cobalamin/Fe3+-siderophores transport system ATPase subunit
MAPFNRTVIKENQMKSKTPAHYTSLSLGNFRGFKKADRIPLAPLTFLVGPNSSGKSSIYDALLLLTQSEVLLTDEPPLVPEWGGPLVDLGSFKDTVFEHNPSLTIRLAVELSLASSTGNGELLHSSQQPAEFEFEIRSSKKDPVGNIRSIRIIDSVSSEQMTMRFQPGASPRFKQKGLGMIDKLKLGQEREGTGYPFADLAGEIERRFEKPRGSPRGKRAVARRNAWRRITSYMRSSEHFVAYIAGTQRVSSGRAAPRRLFSTTTPDELLPNSARKIFNGVYPAMVEADHRTQLSYLAPQKRSNRRVELNRILKQLNIASAISATHLSPYHSKINIKDSVTKITSNLIDVGYGASQVIPVITACLSNRAGPLFVEQPEIHLHPKAQGTVAELLCDTSLHRQVFIETHSVHMINRARLRVAQRKLDPKRVVIIYVDRDSHGSQAQVIPLKENGDFGATWPGGFFDERYEDTMALLELKSEGDKH